MLRLFNIIITFLILTSVSSYGQQNQKKTYFAIGLFTGAHSSLVTYAFVTYYGDKFVGSEVVRKDRFMYSIMGYWPCKANPDKINLLEAYGVDSCFLIENQFGKISGYYSPIFEELWKIRFYEHPMIWDTRGWSQGQYIPSRFQKDFLYEHYGIRNILTEYIYGETMFQLLRDMQNPKWVLEYRFAAPDTLLTTIDTTNTGP